VLICSNWSFTVGTRPRILAERDHTEQAQGQRMGWAVLKCMITSRAMWGMILTQGCGAYSLYLFTSWLPRYFQLTRGVDILKTSGLTAVPYIVSAVLVVAISRLSDRVIGNAAVASGQRRNIVAANLLVASVITLVPYVSSLAAILVIFSVSLACVASALSLNTALVNDLLRTTEASASAVSVVLLGGNFFGIISPIITGYIVAATGDFGIAFEIAGVLLAIGAIISFTLTRGTINALAEPPAVARAERILP
jgi:ACS family glucarate transporter-like MFS transporter